MNKYSSTSCLVLFFIFSLFHHFPCASSKQVLRWCETLFQCGNITAGFPFWGGNRLKPCGHPLLELQCNQSITSLIISNQEYQVFYINQTSYTLRLARPDLLGPFCSAKFITTTFLSPIFELPRTYKRLTVYNSCDTRLHYLSSYTCPDKGLVSLSQNPDYQYSCQNSFTVNVPTSFVPKEKTLNLTDLEIVLRKGFDLEVVIDGRKCQECVSSGGICGFNNIEQVCCNVTLASGVQCRTVYYSPWSIYERCRASFSCGDQDNLQYPFWIPGREECGHPDFKLNCSKGFPELNIASVKFRILNMSVDSGIIRLVRSDYISNICPLDPLNVPFNGRVLPLAPDTKLLTLYYDCPDFSSDFLYSGYIGELGCVNHEKSYYVTKNISTTLHDRFSGSLKNLKGLCKRNVSIPASGPALITLQRVPTLDNLKKAIEQGFELALDRDCLACKKVWGACGYSQISSGFICYCQNGSQSYTCDSEILKRNHGLFTKAEIGSVVGVILFACLVLLISFLISLLKIKIADNMRQKKLKAHIPLKHYSFAKAKKITNSFAEVVGRGGFGTVYKGTLSDGRRVAVKVLKDSKGNGEDFMNEVASMSKTSHVNIVSLLGYCFEGSRRAIIYEFVGNGSLDRFISGKISMNMDWNASYGIALGVARGLEYLHYGCKTRIVHFDIKPQNVLLDDNLCPKVSDFGLAKLCEKKESILSLLDTRGTVGYIAPEMISRVYGSVSHKSDVYSYGMLVLEMIGARNKEKVDQEVGSNSSSMYFPDWVYKDLETRNYGRVIGDEISSEEEEIAKKMTLVGLWCIQSSPSDRPPMNRVVEMMEGKGDPLVVPPKPVLQQIPTSSLPDSSWNSEESSRSSSTSEVYLRSTN